MMFGKRVVLITASLFCIGIRLCGGWAGGEDFDNGLVIQSKTGQDTLYFRKQGGNRWLDPAPGSQAVSENVSGALFMWGGYYAQQPFSLGTLRLHLNLDVTILSAAEPSLIKREISRRGIIVYTTVIYELPAGQSGTRQVDILTDQTIYPAISFNQGDELSFRFQKTDNLLPCKFRYNDEGGRDDSHLIVERSGPDFPVIELSPTDFVISIEPEAMADTTLKITNVGSRRLSCDVKLPLGLKTLLYHDEDETQSWSISDQYGQDLYNVRFSPAQDCTLKLARLLLSQHGTAGSPDLMVYAWEDADGFPGAKLDSVLTSHSALNFFPNWQEVTFANKGLAIEAHQDFHIGHTSISHSPGDSLAIYSDDGLPVSNQRRSSLLWGENWKTIYDRHDKDVNFMIEATLEYGDEPGWISTDSPHIVLDPGATHQINIQLDAAGLSDGIYKSGVVINSRAPYRASDPLVLVPVTVQVGQTSVEESTSPIPPARGSLVGSCPNPFNPSTRIHYQVNSPGRQPVRLIVYNVLGQLVRQLVDGFQPPGSYQVEWDGRDEAGREMASGLYFCRLQAGEVRETAKMLLIR